MTPVRQASFVEVPGYRIIRRIGQGGMATIYLATQLDLNRTVALKVLSPERTPDAESVARFENEARTIARLDHPHIVSIHEVGRTESGQLYFSMPSLPRGDLTTLPHRRDPQVIIRVMRALLDALAYAHDHGVVHRDVKPENVLFDALNQPQLADFGIALSLRDDLRVTRVGTTVGSSGYMSPEQARGLPTDGRADLYSVGVMLYELLTGEMPYQGLDALSVAIAHAEDPVPVLPPELAVWQPVIDGALAKHPEDRFADARSMRAELDRAAQRLQEGRGANRLRHWWRAGQARGATGAWVGAAALLASVAVLAVLMVSRRTPTSAAALAGADTRVSAHAATAARAERDIGALLGADQLDQLISEGNARLQAGALATPDGKAAADDFLRVLRTYPANPEALAGLKDVFAALQQRIEQALANGDDAGATEQYRAAQRLADRGGIRERPFWPEFVAAIRAATSKTLARAARGAPQRLDGLQPLASALDLPVPQPVPQPPPSRSASASPRSTAAAAPLQRGSAIRDPDGPPLIVVSTTPADAYALGRAEVTRAEYASFVAASGRKPSACRRLHNVFSAILDLSWEAPGFEQGKDDPVVCVSWHDARAYVGWLSLRTGQHYRLPSSGEWLAAAHDTTLASPCTGADCDAGEHTHGVDGAAADGLADMHGNVSEWMLCSGRCDTVTFRGGSWRDGRDEKLPSGRSDPDTGYTSVGFRVLRELDVPAAAGQRRR
ncbi:MAG TPA: bifunctional serine/threonine-protein kinase/formylglycine-generating enzyme family protein [Rhodanobacteraceae bacterium]|nr:bifunctional serine/threonine-protein kinase/formylglycine-generating enzyme family protein [Rhodanobacteraceae bacterium]